MIFSRYIKFLDSIIKNRRLSIVSLLKTVSMNTKSVTGNNIRCILKVTDTLIIPGKTSKDSLSDYKVYNIPDGEEWRVPLLESLIEIREKRWEVQFNEEANESLNEDAIKLLINRACVD